MPVRLGEEIKTVVAIVPQASAAATVNGASTSRDGYEYGVLSFDTGAATGAPTAVDVDVTVEESADGSTGWAAVSGLTISDVAASQHKELNVDLRGRKLHIRAVAVVAFTGGTSPTLPIAASWVLGEPATLPVE